MKYLNLCFKIVSGGENIIWLISEIVNPYVMERDINRMSVEIYDDNWHNYKKLTWK
ncbi:MAG: hypothetical protein RMJ38_05840 [candidate division WOR-3 bacterium]|nr:hypothetical protein [candidate division WOR-3 bacterium]MDW8150944.1 hypothetical protein [candidate division WOR-3 bacterium]